MTIELRYNAKGKIPKISEEAMVVDGACITGDVEVGAKTTIWYNAVIRGDFAPIKIGRETSIQDCVVIHGDPGGSVSVGDRVTLGHGAVLHGCIIEDDVVIGMNAVVLDEAVVEKGSIIGANSLVRRGQHIQAGVIAVGNPVKVIRSLTEEEKQGIQKGVELYVGLIKQYSSLEE